MTRHLLSFFLLLVSVVGTDARSNEVAHPNRPKRIVSLSPAITELLFEIKASNLIVGTSEYSDYPEAAKQIPRVGSYQRPSIEKIVAMKPDLVLLSDEGVDQISTSLARFKIPYQVFRMQRLENFKQAVLDLGQLLAVAVEAKQAADNFEEALSKVTPDCQSQKVLILLEEKPAIAAAASTFLDDGLSKCGCTNAVSNRKGYVRLDREALSGLAAARRLSLAMPVPERHADLVRLGPRFPKALQALCKELGTR